MLVDHALGARRDDRTRQARLGAAAHRADQPADRHELAGLQDAGFTGYLVKPVRARFARGTAHGQATAWSRRSPTRPTRRCPAPPTASGSPVLVAEDNEINALLVARRCSPGSATGRPSPRTAPRRLKRWQRRASGRHALRSRADGRAHARHRRPRRRPAASAPRKPRPASPRTPILALTANASPRIARRASLPGWTSSWSSRSTANGCVEALARVLRAALAACASPSRANYSLRSATSSTSVALALLQDQFGALPRRQDVLVQVHQIDPLPDRRGGLDRLVVARGWSSGGNTTSDRGTRSPRSVRNRSTYQRFSTSSSASR